MLRERFRIALPALALAQVQVVEPPIALYWMSAETAAGMAMPGMPTMAGGMMGPRGRMLLYWGCGETLRAGSRSRTYGKKCFIIRSGNSGSRSGSS